MQDIGKKVKKANLTFTVGGSVSKKTIDKINNEYKDLKEIIYKLETRKVILPSKTFVGKKNAINEVLKFEELYILSKKDFSDVQISSEISRLTELKGRK